MIKTFSDKRALAIFARKRIKGVSVELQRKTLQKLRLLNKVNDVEELRIPPGNRLERLSGDRNGQYSIRVNQQWRICFHWIDGHAENVELVDYH
ncbi:type II toxin-antitoxin system RelE/ParE family toxin [Terasakiella pusilla]|uniref:type II toxin-antitoxin system RelE/ParE family toxin n=1 Tax=Terasakiella pusilla TaxID=64973 RepID=UPI000490852B|nr:type II toxin-antitoxin system RelE/ParE family toxin [Terasakiella pusilla]